MTRHVLCLEEGEKKEEKKNMTTCENCPSFIATRHISKKKKTR